VCAWGIFLFHLIAFAQLEPSQFLEKKQPYFYLGLAGHFGEFPSAVLQHEGTDNNGLVPRMLSALILYKFEGKSLK